MESPKKSDAGASGNECSGLFSNLDIKAASEYAHNHIKKMEALDKKVDNMGSLGLFWDSKVPQKDMWFFNFISFQYSNKEQVKQEIIKYQEFYTAMHRAMEKLRGNKEKSDEESDNICVIINDLEALLIEMAKVADSDLGTTSSSTVYNLHKEFEWKHKQVENMVKRVDSVVSRNRIKTVEKLLKDYDTKIEKLEKLKTEMEEKFGGLVSENAKQRRQQDESVKTEMEKKIESVLADNEKLKAEQRNLIRQYNKVYDRMEKAERLIRKHVIQKKEDEN